MDAAPETRGDPGQEQRAEIGITRGGDVVLTLKTDGRASEHIFSTEAARWIAGGLIEAAELAAKITKGGDA